MSYDVRTLPDFLRVAKRLKKKRRSLASDLNQLIDSLAIEPTQGTPIEQGCYKIRLTIKSKGKGKSGGARVITTVFVDKEQVYLIDIYDKSERSSISKAELTALLGELGDVDDPGS